MTVCGIVEGVWTPEGGGESIPDRVIAQRQGHTGRLSKEVGKAESGGAGEGPPLPPRPPFIDVELKNLAQHHTARNA